MPKGKKLLTFNSLAGIQALKPPIFRSPRGFRDSHERNTQAGRYFDEDAQFYMNNEVDDFTSSGGGRQQSSGNGNAKAQLNFVVDDESYRQVNEQRQPCTDWPFCILFCVFIVGMIMVSIVALSSAAANDQAGLRSSAFFSLFSFSSIAKSRLFLPTDYLGRVCGTDYTNAADGLIVVPNDRNCQRDPLGPACQDRVRQLGLREDLRKRKYLWYMDLSNPQKYGGICVQYCPGSLSGSGVQYCPPELRPQSQTMLDNSTGTPIEKHVTYDGICLANRIDILSEDENSFPRDAVVRLLSQALPYRSVMHRCVPVLDTPSTPSNVTQEFSDDVGFIRSKLNSLTAISNEAWSDVARSWKVLVLSLALAIGLGLGLLFFVRFFAAAFVWGSVSLVFLLLSLIGVYGIFDGISEKHYIELQGLRRYAPDLILYGSIGLICLSFLYAFVVALFLRQIKRAILILREASRSLSAMPQIFLVPVVLLTIYLFFAIAWINVGLALWSSAYTVVDELQADFVSNKMHRLLLAFHIFGAFWTTQFMLAYMYTTISGAVSTWYWSRSSSSQQQEGGGSISATSASTVYLHQPVIRAAIRPLLYHIGSLAFGSLVVSMVQYLSYIVLRMLKQAERISGNNVIVRWLTWFARFLIAILNKIVNEVTKHAYIQIAIYGAPFLQSSRNALALIRKNSSQIVVVDWIGDAILVMGQVAVALATTYIAHLLSKMSWLITGDGGLNTSPTLVLVIVFVMAFVVAKIFATVYETATDTVLQCYLIDTELAASSGRGNLYAPPSFVELMDDEKHTYATDMDMGHLDL